MSGHEEKVNAVAIMPDGCRAISASDDKTLRVWDLSSGIERLTLRTDPSISRGIKNVAILLGGRRVVSTDYFPGIQGFISLAEFHLTIWDTESGVQLHVEKFYTAPVTVLAVTPDGNRVLFARDGTLFELDCLDMKWSCKRLCVLGRINAMSLIANGRYAVCASEDNTVKVQDMESGGNIGTLRGHTSEVSTVAVATDNRRVVSGSSDNTLKVWDLETGSVTAVFFLDVAVTSVAVSPDGRSIIAGDSGGQVHCLRVVLPGDPV